MIQYYSALRNFLYKYNIKQSKIYNLDETPCPLNNIPRYSIWKKEIKDAHISQPDNRMVLTMMACVASNGTSLPPLNIYQGKTVGANYVKESMNVLIASNENAYMTQDILRSWPIQFVQFTNLTREHPVLLIVDSFIGHLDVIYMATMFY